MRIMPEVTAAAQAPALSPEVWQGLILLSIGIALGLALASALAWHALERRQAIDSDGPDEPPTRSEIVRGWVLLAVLAVQTTVALSGALGVL